MKNSSNRSRHFLMGGCFLAGLLSLSLVANSLTAQGQGGDDDSSLVIKDGTVNVNAPLIVKGSVTAENLTGHGTIPVGAIIDWWRPTPSTPIPDGFLIADGSTINDDKSPMNGKHLPNLINRFVRGTAEAEIGAGGFTEGGNDNHTHGRGTLVNSSGGVHSHIWLNSTSAKKMTSYDESGAYPFPMVTWGDGMDTDGKGFYAVGFEGEQAWGRKINTNKSGDHTHDITGSTATGSNLPAYVGLIKLVRVF